MGILLCEQNFRDVWSRNESVRAEIGQIVHTDTHTHNRGKISSTDNIDHASNLGKSSLTDTKNSSMKLTKPHISPSVCLFAILGVGVPY